MKHKILILTLTALIFSSCEGLLDRFPLDAPPSANFYSNEDELRLAVNGAYRSLYWLSNQNVPYQLFIEGATDLVWIRGDYANMQYIQRGESTPETGVFKSVWSTFYGYISRCNNLLDNMSNAKGNVPDEYYNRIEAEAKFLRAYNYFYLINLYGDVPFVDHTLDWRDPYVTMASKEDIIDQLFEDLDFAIDNLPLKAEGADRGRATKGTAFGLKARIALNAGRFEEAKAAADSVIHLGVYEIHPSYKNLFLYAGTDSKEIMMFMPFVAGLTTNAIPQFVGTRSAPGYSVIVPTQTLVDMYQCTDGKRIDQSPLFNPTKPYENRDPRLDFSILRPGVWHGGYRFETHPDSILADLMVNGEVIRVPNLEATNAYRTFTGYLFRKYYDEADLPEKVTKSELNYTLMRYAEILLTYAEAKIELNEIDQSVIDALNAVRQRPDVNMPPASLSMSQTELRDLLRYERTIELTMEGFRLFDMRRWRIAEHVMPGYMLGRRTKAAWYTPVIPSFNAYGKPVYPDESIFEKLGFNMFDPNKNYLWPIPQAEIDLNPGLGL